MELGKTMAKNIPMHSIRICVFIPTYNNLNQLKLAIKSWKKIPEVSIYVGIDGSTDGTKEWLESENIPYLNHDNNVNKGRSATRNLSFELIQKFDWIIYMDSDMEFTGTIKELNSDFFNTVWVGSIHYKKPKNNWVSYLETRGASQVTQGDKVRFKDFSTGLVAIPTFLLQQTEGFDTNFVHYGGEDLEMGIQLQRRGANFRKSNLLNAQCNENKTLEFALKQMEEFGSTGLHYIHQKHGDLPPFYSINRNIPSIIIALAKFGINIPNTFIRNKCIHLLVWSAVKKGYSNKI
jgi:glycosyltransferase involved in cell wall biosynthesis